MAAADPAVATIAAGKPLTLSDFAGRSLLCS